MEQLFSTEALDRLGSGRGSPRGRKPLLPVRLFLQSLLFHFLCPAGTLAEHLRLLLGLEHAESTLSKRRQRLVWPLFEALLRLALRPRATPEQAGDAFWRGWRLLAWDGTQFSLTNTPQNLRQHRKAASRRQSAAWAKITCVALIELGLHNPVAAAIGRNGESEYALTHQLLPSIPAQALLLADRLSGCAAMVFALHGQLLALGSHYLVRIRKNQGVLKRRRLRDGSWRLDVGVFDPYHPRELLTVFSVREIVARTHRRGFRGERIRLWTSLLEPDSAPALELARLYTRRWEQELYFRQMKRELRKSDLLQSHTPHTATQEIAMLVLATALLAQERLRAAAGHQPVLDISFLKCLNLLRPLWIILCLAGPLLSPRQLQSIHDLLYGEIQRQRKPPRRQRSCARAVRQPIGKWPRLLVPKYQRGSWTYTISSQSIGKLKAN